MMTLLEPEYLLDRPATGSYPRSPVVPAPSKGAEASVPSFNVHTTWRRMPVTDSRWQTRLKPPSLSGRNEASWRVEFVEILVRSS